MSKTEWNNSVIPPFSCQILLLDCTVSFQRKFGDKCLQAMGVSCDHPSAHPCQALPHTADIPWLKCISMNWVEFFFLI